MKQLILGSLVLMVSVSQAFAGGGSCKVNLVGDPSKGVELVFQRNQADNIFAHARKNFLDEAKSDNYESIFKSLAKGEKPDGRKKLLDQLKAFRKFAIRLRSDYVVLAQDHEVPKVFERFVKRLGKLNDALEFNAWNKVPALAADTLDAFRLKKISETLKSFKAASPGSIVDEIAQIKVEILAMVNKPHLTVEEFHDTRKSLKHLLSLTQAFNEESPSPEFANAFDFLSSVNDTLGDMRQDVLEDEVQSKKKVSHAHDTQDLPDDVKGSVRNFLTALQARLAS